MKIVILDGLALNPGDLSWGSIHELGDVTVYDRTPPEQVVPRIGVAEIVITNKTLITAEILSACPSIRLICVLSTGYNVIDCEAARQRQIPVCNVPAYGTNAVAQFTFSLLLELCNRVGLHDEAVHRGDWANCADFCFWYTPQMELFGKTLGIVGFGRIGQAVGKVAKAMGMRVLAYNRSRSPEGAAFAEYVDFDTLLAQSDIVSLHCPLTAENTGLINKATLAKMKPGAILLNTARGALLNEADVAEALQNGTLRGAAVDVASSEPINPDNPLLTAPNCVITPHIAWSPVESRQRIIDITASNVRAFLENKPCNVVNNVL